MYYAKSTGGFYDASIHGDAIPSDAVEITTVEHATLLAGQSAGKMIVADDEGYPGLADPPKATAAQVWERIKAERDRRKAAGVKVGAAWFHSDEGSRIQQIGLVMMGAAIPAGLQWKTMDGSFVGMTQALAGLVFAAVAVSDQTIFAVAEQHKAAMEAAADPSTYNFSASWPKSFGEI